MAGDREERRRDKRRSEARARSVYGARLAWIEGFPVETPEGWTFQTVPRHGAAARVQLDAQRVEGSVRAARQVGRDLKDAGGGVTPEELLPGWSRLEPALAILGDWRRGRGAADPFTLLGRRGALLGQRLARDAELAPMVRAAGWAFALTGDELPALEWLAEQSVALRAMAAVLPGGMAECVAVALARIALGGEASGAGRVAAMLGDPVLHRSILEGPAGSTEEAANRPPGTGAPAGGPRPLGAELAELVIRLLEIPPEGRPRGRVIDLLVSSLPRTLALAWVEGARARRRHTHDAALVERMRKPPSKRETRPAPPEAPTLPTPLQARRYTDALFGAAALREPVAEALSAVVLALPPDEADAGIRARGVILFHARLVGGPDPGREAARLGALAAVLAEDGPAARQIVAERDLRTCGNGRGGIGDFDPLDTLPERGSLLEHLRLLPRITGSGNARQDRRRSWLYQTLVEKGCASAWAADCVERSFEGSDGAAMDFTRGGVTLAVGLGDGSAERTARLLQRLHKDDLDLPERGVARLLALVRRIEALPILEREIEQGARTRAARWVQILLVIDPDRLALLGPAQAAKAEWIQAWPSSLRGALGELAILPDGAARARRLLRRVVPDRATMEGELATLRRKLRRADRPHLSARAASLSARLDAGVQLKPAALRKLDEKLRRAADSGRLALIDDALTGALVEALWPEPPPGGVPDWLRRPEALDLVGAVFGLEGTAGTLGRELLRRRAGPPPWLPWERAANQRFLATLERRGIRTAPWLATRATTTTLDDKPLHLALEDDPLEILRMGQHFGTCLSPASMNFFSAVSNAVDVNKRVLYGRAPSGAVMARCLLALTAEGRLLTFEPYAHERALRFGERVAAFAAELAGEMGTRTAPAGRVPNLVANDWYDDGTRDLTGQLAQLDDGSTLRAALSTLPIAEAAARLYTVLTEAGTTVAMLQRILALPEVTARCDMGIELARRIRGLPGLGFAERLHLAEWLAGVHRRDTGEWTQLQLARAVIEVPGFLAWLTAPCPDCGPRSGCQQLLDHSAAQLARIDPFLLLRALRKTRKRTVRSLGQEPDERRAAAAEALRRLGRDGEAERLMQSAARPVERG